MTATPISVLALAVAAIATSACTTPPAPATTVSNFVPAPEKAIAALDTFTCTAPEVEYPEAARKAGIGGKVMTRIKVGESGMVERAEVVTSSGNAQLDEAALYAAAAMECIPYRTKSGALAPVLANKPFNFDPFPRRLYYGPPRATNQQVPTTAQQ